MSHQSAIEHEPASDASTTIGQLRERVAAFTRARDWEQFHNPKDLAAAIAIEAAELMELFLWKTPAEVSAAASELAVATRIHEELADVVILCLSMANQLQLDLSDAVARKMAANAAKYPAEVVRGRADKYTHYRDDGTN